MFPIHEDPAIALRDREQVRRSRPIPACPDVQPRLIVAWRPPEVHAAPGTAVRVHAWPVSQQGAVPIHRPQHSECLSKRGECGEQAVNVEFVYNDIDVLGRSDQVQVGVAQMVVHGSTLGYMRQ
jgi:hypothetical protein